jgi:hypothetical protein
MGKWRKQIWKPQSDFLRQGSNTLRSEKRELLLRELLSGES